MKENDEDNDDGVYEVLSSVTKGEKRLDSALESGKELWKTFVDLVECNDMRDVFELNFSETSSIQSIERSSSSHERKHNSFLGRWFGKDPKICEENGIHAPNSELMIERDRLIMCQVKNNTYTSTQNIPAKYRVIGVYDKSYNKWFMAKENKKHWILLSQQDKKKHKVAIHMVEDVDMESL
jgi:hypothetical protein